MKDAQVIVFAKELPDKEELTQMIGRGQRAAGNYSGTIYHVDNPEFKEIIEERMKSEVDLDFKDAAINLRVLIKLIEKSKIKNSKIEPRVVNAANKRLMTSFEDMMSKFHDPLTRQEMLSQKQTLKKFNT